MAFLVFFQAMLPIHFSTYPISALVVIPPSFELETKINNKRISNTNEFIIFAENLFLFRKKNLKPNTRMVWNRNKTNNKIRFD